MGNTNNKDLDNNEKNVDYSSLIKASIKDKIFKFLLMHPSVLIIIITLFILFIILLCLFTTDSKNDSTYGLMGYDFIDIGDYCKDVTVKNSEYAGTYELEEYVAGVLKGEVSSFSDSKTSIETLAIAARTYALNYLKYSSNCTIDGTSRKQNFIALNNSSNDEKLKKAAYDTRGLVVTIDNQIISTQYDAFCWETKDENYYNMCQPNLGTDEKLKIPIEWANEYVPKKSSSSFLKSPTKNHSHHGNGMSQVGEYYLATEKQWTTEEILRYFYGDDIKIMSIYPGLYGNYNQVTSSGSNNLLTIPIRDYLNNHGSSVESFNEFMLKNIVEAGFGTRAGAVSAAISLVGGLYQYFDIRIPYTLSGQHYTKNMLNENGENVNRTGNTFYGLDPNWGSKIHNNGNSDYHYKDGRYNHHYDYYGPDCSGFVPYIIHNAGFNISITSISSYRNRGKTQALNGTQVAIPGDIIIANDNSHIMFVVGVDEAKEVYYIAHASCGTNGVIISTLKFNKSGKTAIDMTEWYEKNRLNITTEEFIEKFRNGYVDGYTGNHEIFDIPKENDVYFVGDSRTVGMLNVNNICSDTTACNNSNVIAEVGKGLTWLENNKNTIKKNIKHTVIINIGVNDLTGNCNPSEIANKYFNVYKDLASAMRMKNIIITSINPVGEGGSVNQSNIDTFNETMENLIAESGYNNMKYLNTNNVSFDYITTDKIHYNNETYKHLYKYLMGEIV